MRTEQRCTTRRCPDGLLSCTSALRSRALWQAAFRSNPDVPALLALGQDPSNSLVGMRILEQHPSTWYAPSPPRTRRSDISLAQYLLQRASLQRSRTSL